MDPIAIRFSTDADHERVLELAQLDTKPAPEGEVLLAEQGGRVVAALGLADGLAVADPFARSAPALDLLRLRAEQEHERRHGRGPLLGRLMLLRQRAGIIA